MRGRTAVEFWSETLRALKLATSVVAVTVGAFNIIGCSCWSGALRWLQRPWLIWILRCVYAAGRFTEAVGYGRQAVPQRQGFSGGHRIYVASLALDGQIDEARMALDRLKELQ